MPRIETLRSIAIETGHADMPVLRRRASSSTYDAGGTGRRAIGWQASRLGPTTLLWGNLDQIRSRSREQVRNNPWAASAVDKFESNVIGTGIVPHWQHKDPNVVDKITSCWGRSMKQVDFAGQLDFYGLQGLVAREVFEGGEVFSRYRLSASRRDLLVPLQVQLIEGEQVPVWLNSIPGQIGNMIRAGIEFNPEGLRVAYRMYKEHPGETMFYPLDALVWISVPADEILHVMKPLRIGQLRGQPHLTPVLTLLYELDQYSDAELVRKKVSAMFAGFITKPSLDDQVIPPAPGNNNTLQGHSAPDIGTDIAKLESGTLQQLLPGEEITFPQVPDSSDFSAFINVQLHKFAAGIGLTYEQISGDLRGVNYSSIRAGLLEFRRSCEQFQFNVIVNQFCEPIKNRWLKEAVLSGALDLGRDYFANPSQFEDVVWVAPGFEWVDPLKEMQAAQMAVRSGFSSRTMVVRSLGYDPKQLDAQQAEERNRAATFGIVYDSDPNKILVGRESDPDTKQDAKPNQETKREEDLDDTAALVTSGKPPKRMLQ